MFGLVWTKWCKGTKLSGSSCLPAVVVSGTAEAAVVVSGAAVVVSDISVVVLGSSVEVVPSPRVVETSSMVVLSGNTVVFPSCLVGAAVCARPLLNNAHTAKIRNIIDILRVLPPIGNSEIILFADTRF